MRTVAIVGTSPANLELVNQEPPTTEIWTCTGAYAKANRSDRHFELHKWEDLPAAYKDGWEVYSTWLTHHKGTVYMPKPDSRVPNSMEYPLDEVTALLGLDFGSTIAYMVGLAILEHQNGDTVSALNLIGVDMSTEEEYGHQQQNLKGLLRIAKFLGINVNIPENSALLQKTLYAFDDLYDTQIKIRNDIKAIDRELRTLDSQVRAAKERRMQAQNYLDWISGIRGRENYNAIMNDLISKKSLRQAQETKQKQNGVLPPEIKALQESVLKEQKGQRNGKGSRNNSSEGQQQEAAKEEHSPSG